MRKWLYFWAALLWSGIITFLCLAQFNNVPLGNVSNLDKVVHAFFYFVLTIFFFLFLRDKYTATKRFKLLLFSFLFSLCFGIAIEIAQGVLTLNRHSDVFDVLANSAGATLAIALLVLLNLNTTSDTTKK